MTPAVIDVEVISRVSLPPAPARSGGGWLIVLVFGPGVTLGIGMLLLTGLVLTGILR